MNMPFYTKKSASEFRTQFGEGIYLLLMAAFRNLPHDNIIGTYRLQNRVNLEDVSDGNVKGTET